MRRHADSKTGLNPDVFPPTQHYDERLNPRSERRNQEMAGPASMVAKDFQFSTHIMRSLPFHFASNSTSC